MDFPHEIDGAKLADEHRKITGHVVRHFMKKGHSTCFYECKECEFSSIQVGGHLSRPDAYGPVI